MKVLSVFLSILFFSSTAVYADQNVYLYSAEVAALIDVEEYLVSGEVVVLTGPGSEKNVVRGPAPAPYPQILLWEPGIEQLGASGAETDGIVFVNHGTHWVKNRLALVLWRIDIPQASARLAGEFGEDLTVALWVDWNQDQLWNKNEVMIRRHINLQEYVPFQDQTVHVYYLTAFRVPDLDAWLSMLKKGDNNRDVLDLWVRGVLAYDDSDMSPDGEQLFGDVEDYRVRYMMTPRPRTKRDPFGG
ncbi:MAG: GEVED domain-containing protein [Candidatus Krumholzibacteria bacterium]|nr:GEVED domain-containing protein [Candidatus Krumholzibacteria bacterium]